MVRKVLERRPAAEGGARGVKGGRAGSPPGPRWAPPNSGLRVQCWARLGQGEVLRAEPLQEKGPGGRPGLCTGDRGSIGDRKGLAGVGEVQCKAVLTGTDAGGQPAWRLMGRELVGRCELCVGRSAISCAGGTLHPGAIGIRE